VLSVFGDEMAFSLDERGRENEIETVCNVKMILRHSVLLSPPKKSQKKKDPRAGSSLNGLG
jgi:hypothetical protein